MAEVYDFDLERLASALNGKLVRRFLARPYLEAQHNGKTLTAEVSGECGEISLSFPMAGKGGEVIDLNDWLSKKAEYLRKMYPIDPQLISIKKEIEEAMRKRDFRKSDELDAKYVQVQKSSDYGKRFRDAMKGDMPAPLYGLFYDSGMTFNKVSAAVDRFTLLFDLGENLEIAQELKRDFFSADGIRELAGRLEACHAYMVSEGWFK